MVLDVTSNLLSSPAPFEVYGTPGTLELLLVISREPLRDALRALQRIASARGIRSAQPTGLEADEADSVVSILLGDINRASRDLGVRVPASSKAIDMGKLAALSAVFQVVK